MSYGVVTQDIEKLILYNRAEKSVPLDEFVDTINVYWNYIEGQIKALGKEEAEQIYGQLRDDLNSKFTGALKKFFATVLLDYYRDGFYARLLCRELLNQEIFDRDEAYFALRQLLSFDFDHPGIIDIEDVNELYDVILDSWHEEMRGSLLNLTPGDKDRILVISTHVAGFRHAPTKTLFERMDTLIREMNKTSMVIHSMETLTQKEYFPFYNAADGIVIDDYKGIVNISLPEGTSFELYQPEQPMPNVSEMNIAIDIIKQFNPGRIIVMGDYSILGDVVADKIPTINMSFGFAGLNKKTNQHVCVFRYLKDKDYEQIDKWNVDRNRYIEGVFTFRFVPQTHSFTHKELGLPEDAFIIMAVGNRLGADLTDEYLQMLGTLSDNRWHLAMAGANAEADYTRMCEKYPFMKEHSTYLGFVDDILAFMECCDLYVNPPRLGGGFSVAEAFSKRIPGVSLSYGDVAAAAGKEFCVDTLDEMKSEIERYMSDEAYYQLMGEKAYNRSLILQDSKAALEAVMDEFEKRLSIG